MGPSRAAALLAAALLAAPARAGTFAPVARAPGRAVYSAPMPKETFFALRAYLKGPGAALLKENPRLATVRDGVASPKMLQALGPLAALLPLDIETRLRVDKSESVRRALLYAYRAAEPAAVREIQARRLEAVASVGLDGSLDAVRAESELLPLYSFYGADASNAARSAATALRSVRTLADARAEAESLSAGKDAAEAAPEGERQEESFARRMSRLRRAAPAAPGRPARLAMDFLPQPPGELASGAPGATLASQARDALGVVRMPLAALLPSLMDGRVQGMRDAAAEALEDPVFRGRARSILAAAMPQSRADAVGGWDALVDRLARSTRQSRVGFRPVYRRGKGGVESGAIAARPARDYRAAHGVDVEFNPWASDAYLEPRALGGLLLHELAHAELDSDELTSHLLEKAYAGWLSRRPGLEPAVARDARRRLADLSGGPVIGLIDARYERSELNESSVAERLALRKSELRLATRLGSALRTLVSVPVSGRAEALDRVPDGDRLMLLALLDQAGAGALSDARLERAGAILDQAASGLETDIAALLARKNGRAAPAAAADGARAARGALGRMPQGVRVVFQKAALMAGVGGALYAGLLSKLHGLVPHASLGQLALLLLPIGMLALHYGVVAAFWAGRYFAYPRLAAGGRRAFERGWLWGGRLWSGAALAALAGWAGLMIAMRAPPALWLAFGVPLLFSAGSVVHHFVYRISSGDGPLFARLRGGAGAPAAKAPAWTDWRRRAGGNIGQQLRKLGARPG